NLLSYVVINFVMSMRNAIMGSVGLMIIGLGNYDPTNWGAMINAAKSKGLINPDNHKRVLYPLILIMILQVAA
ncbi:MAG: ABC transporter permease, partial [Clostridia bacterium]